MVDYWTKKAVDLFDGVPLEQPDINFKSLMQQLKDGELYK
jgi:hypothetical protein